LEDLIIYWRIMGFRKLVCRKGTCSVKGNHNVFVPFGDACCLNSILLFHHVDGGGKFLCNTGS
jgi:hypothetical protein